MAGGRGHILTREPKGNKAKCGSSERGGVEAARWGGLGEDYCELRRVRSNRAGLDGGK